MKKLVVIGDPIGHSLSPLMQNAALAALGLEKEFHYDKLLVKSAELAGFANKIRSGEIFGANVTLPHKVAIMAHLDTLTREAQLVGAVNMLWLDNGKVVGNNTDGIGCINALKENGVSVAGKNIVMLGAGGAARAVAFALALNSTKEITILNRTAERAWLLADELHAKAGAIAKAGELEKARDNLDGADVLINCTSLGMENNKGTVVLSKHLPRSLVVMDIVYRPLKTRLLREAEEAGCRTINGVGMLVHQGAASLEAWTGKRAPIGIMKKAVLSELDEN